MFDKCPGMQTVLIPTIKLKKCPHCGQEIEVVSTDMKTNCTECGFTIYNNAASCVQWCEHARECVGEDVYQKLKKSN
jgi:NADH pyrophosphatase NudC (nudix superfamily)